MIDFSTGEWIVVIVAGAMLLGFAKTGMPGINMVFVPILATILPAKESTGFLLPLLIVGDIFAVIYYKSHTQWRHLVKLLPFSFLGIVAGYFTMRALENTQIKPIIGVIVLLMLAVQVYRTVRKIDESIPKGIWFALIMGFLAGYTTMVANAAGPAMAIYLLAMRLPKEQYVGTGAWYFFIVNLFKVPLSASLGLITAQSLLTGAVLIPAIAVGAFIGIKLLPLIPQKAFNTVILLITVVSAIRLLI
ncbi:MAG: sulfite exporter TauE/SafE family protein [Spirochaetales bacterium]|nr:sulfite exporter TauE/SafE family protein [Spirochaetales bacterium]